MLPTAEDVGDCSLKPKIYLNPKSGFKPKLVLKLSLIHKTTHSGVSGKPGIWERARAAYNGGLGAEPPPPQRGPGAELLVTGSRGEAPESERLLAFGHPLKATNLPYSLKALRVQMFTGTL